MESYFTQTPVATFIFILTLATSLYAFSNPIVLGKFMLNPYSVSRGTRSYSIFTSGLIHKDFGHLFMNMFSYYYFAFTLESILGHWQFAVLYIGSLALSDISTILKYKHSPHYYSLGASGAVSAVVFSYILFNPKASFLLLFIPIPINAIVFGCLYLFYSYYSSKQSSQINHDAHFYGALSGILLTILFYPQVVPYFIRQLGVG